MSKTCDEMIYSSAGSSTGSESDSDEEELVNDAAVYSPFKPEVDAYATNGGIPPIKLTYGIIVRVQCGECNSDSDSDTHEDKNVTVGRICNGNNEHETDLAGCDWEIEVLDSRSSPTHPTPQIPTSHVPTKKWERGSDLRVVCSYCWNNHESLQLCGSCYMACYCNEHCQSRHWNAHETDCSRYAEIKECFIQETKLADLPFVFKGHSGEVALWPCLQMLGWKWNGTYRPPLDGRYTGERDPTMREVLSCSTWCVPTEFTDKELIGFLDGGGKGTCFQAGVRRHALAKAAINEGDSREDQVMQYWSKCVKDDILGMYFVTNRAILLVLEEMRKDYQVNNRPASETKLDETKTEPHHPIHTSTTKTSNDTSASSIEPGAQTYLTRASSTKKARKPSTNESNSLPSFYWPTPQECVEALHENPPEVRHATELAALQKTHEAKFEEWRFLLSTNHSLLFYGYGSKRDLLNQFAYEELRIEGDTIHLDSFHRDFHVSDLLDTLVHQFLNGNEPDLREDVVFPPQWDSERALPCDGRYSMALGSPPPLVKRAALIASRIATRNTNHHHNQTRPVFLILHNIDGINLRNAHAQMALAALVVHSALPNNSNGIRLCASVDHVNSAVALWDTCVASNFSWLWQDVTTYEPCLVEIRDGMHLDESLCKQTKQTHDQNQNQTQTNTNNNVVKTSNLAVNDVLESLAPRHAEVLDSLARMQMGLAMNTTDTPQTSSSVGGHAVDYGVFKEHCAARMISSSEKHLREMLKELIDHGLVESVRPNTRTNETPTTAGVDHRTGTEALRIPHSKDQLQLILEYANKR
mmetsp:Transcript_54296/g.63453  ORF Transcript_54296/g.63453 Transcript_54296/m.63453 type:complete len:812 (-) Transcript_54296:113-2548(-)